MLSFQLRRAVWPKQFGHRRSRDQVRHQHVPWRCLRVRSQRRFQCPQLLRPGVPPYKKNDFGYTIGGPVDIPGLYNRARPRHFFFFSRSGGGNACPARNSTLPVPSCAERGLQPGRWRRLHRNAGRFRRFQRTVQPAQRAVGLPNQSRTGHSQGTAFPTIWFRSIPMPYRCLRCFPFPTHYG